MIFNRKKYDNKKKQSKLESIFVYIMFLILSFLVEITLAVLFYNFCISKYSISSPSYDGFLGFMGSLFGAFAAIIAVQIQLRFEKDRSIEEKSIEFKPIMILNGIDYHYTNDLHFVDAIFALNDCDIKNSNNYFALRIKNCGRGEANIKNVEASIDESCKDDRLNIISLDTFDECVVAPGYEFKLLIYVPNFKDIILSENHFVTISIYLSDYSDNKKYRLDIKLHILLGQNENVPLQECLFCGKNNALYIVDYKYKQIEI